jgi:hypothetical protein
MEIIHSYFLLTTMVVVKRRSDRFRPRLIHIVSAIGVLFLGIAVWSALIITNQSRKDVVFDLMSSQVIAVGHNVIDGLGRSSTDDTVTIGYAVSVTGCGSDPITEGAAVLKHSIHLTSIRAGVGKYDYKLYAIVHPDAMECGAPLEELGYTVLKRETPIAVKDIKGKFLRERIESNG